MFLAKTKGKKSNHVKEKRGEEKRRKVSARPPKTGG
jgi:hypothetical protein